MHTLYDSAFKNLERLSNKELSKIINNKDASEELRDKANAILWKRLDPQDRDTVEL